MKLTDIVPSNFIEEEVVKDLKSGRVSYVQTRFPPEPSGYWHIGHVMAITIDFETAQKFNGKFNLRLDDTNPKKEDGDFADSYVKDLAWLNMNPRKVIYASVAYFGKIYKMAEKFIKKGLAYVDDCSAEEISKMRGTLTEAGVESPNRNRSIKENLTLFREMKEGKHAEGSKILRAKIDMANPNINMRDPAIYRIVKTPHYKVGSKWNVYPMYDFAHPLQDKFEGVTFSLCDIAFTDHRPLYNWVIEHTGFTKNNPRQIEFGKMLIENALTGKRYLKQLVNDKVVIGWDDPRFLTLVGMRRRGYPAEAIKNFIKASGVTRNEGLSSMSFLESFVRDELNKSAKRVMVVFDKLKINLTNLKENEVCQIENLPNDSVTHNVNLEKEIYIEKDDFAEVPPPKYNRLTLGGVVRLKGAYIIKCNNINKNKKGEIESIDCEIIEGSKSGNDNSGVKAKAAIHWVPAVDNKQIVVREFGNLIKEEYKNVGKELNDGIELKSMLNENSLTTKTAISENYISQCKVGEVMQFMRNGYFAMDKDSNGENFIFNKTVSLKDSFKAQSK